MTEITYYLSGPMSGLPDFNFPAFRDACKQLRACGFTVVSPHEKDSEGDTTRPWTAYLREDISLLTDKCYGFILLPGWPSSTGAKLELSIALALQMPIYFYRAMGTAFVLVDMQTGKVE